MKTEIFIALIISSFAIRQSSFAQGSLAPSGSPAPTMKSLDQIEPRTPISSAPFIITNSGPYYLTANLTGTNNNYGVIIRTGNVTLDLNGFTLLGATGAYSGVLVQGTFTNITVRNGTVCGWSSHGVDAWSYGFPRNLVFERLTVSANGGHGIYTEAASVVRDCLCFSNRLDGIYTQGGLIAGCEARNNAGNGITTYAGVVRDAFVQFNRGNGIEAAGSGCRIVNNACQANGGAGILLVSDNCYVADNVCDTNSNDGILLLGNYNRVEANQLTANILYGVETQFGTVNNVVTRNTASQNTGAFNYLDRGSDDFGPVGTAATATSPWANISH